MIEDCNWKKRKREIKRNSIKVQIQIMLEEWLDNIRNIKRRVAEEKACLRNRKSHRKAYYIIRYYCFRR